jgi:hypothetical protein
VPDIKIVGAAPGKFLQNFIAGVIRDKPIGFIPLGKRKFSELKSGPEIASESHSCSLR